MNWEQVEANWLDLKGKLKEQWGQLTDNDLEVISGQRDQLVAKLQTTYGMGKEQAQEQADKFALACEMREETWNEGV